MQTESTQASWHPAFMPNSISGPIATESPKPLSSPLLEPPLVYKPGKVPATVLSIEPEAVEEDRAAVDEVAGGNSQNPELGDLRDSLATSLPSLGGVELEESLWHNDTAQEETGDLENADYPSEGPGHESKHLSTMSFARTVSEEVNWGEEDAVDPQWNIQRTDTDPFKFMAKSDRTNSFPQVPPVHSAEIIHDETLAHSQAENILNEIEQEAPEDLSGDEENDPEAEAESYAQNSTQPEQTRDFLEGNDADEDELRLPDYGQLYGGDVRIEQDEELEARFEEGFPIVPSHELDEPQYELPLSYDPFTTDGANEEDFFAQASKVNDGEELTVPEPHLERKSTTEVMDSLHYQPHEQIHDAIHEEDAVESSPISLDRSNGGVIAASSSIVPSAVLRDPEASIDEDLLQSDEGDLAAKWKAALAGDEFLPDDDDELLPDDDESTESAALDPATLFESDDEGFLEDNDQNAENLFGQQTSPPTPMPVTGHNGHVVGFDTLTGAAKAQRPASSSNKYLPAGAAVAPPVAPRDAYAPSAPLFTDLSNPGFKPAAASPYMSSSTTNFQPQRPRPEMPKAQSFVDKSKGGYASPYDLPMDIVKPRKRVSMQTINRAHAPPDIAPPRSSGMQHQSPRAASTGPLLTNSHMQPGHILPGSQPQPLKAVRKSQSGFFEDLPMSRPKPAARHSSGLASPMQSPYGQPGVVPPPSGPPRSFHGPSHIQKQPMEHQHIQQQQPAQVQGLVAPERVSPYASLPTGNMPVPVIASGYSHAPPPLKHRQTAPPVAQSRYSPAPPSIKQAPAPYNAVNSQPPQSAPILSHQPRTSSPLAHFERNQDLRSRGSFSEAGSFDRRSSSSGYESGLRNQHLPPTSEVEEEGQLSPISTRNYGDLQSQYKQPAQTSPARQISRTPPLPPQGLATRLVNSPPKRGTSNYMPQQSSQGAPPPFPPPQRSQTQSPGSAFAGPRLEMSSSVPYQRPASVEIPPSPRANTGYQTTSVPSSQGRERGFSQGLTYAAPMDGREHDPLQRWRGAPVFAWGVGGSVMTSFPQDVPRYGMNSQALIIRSPGTVKIRSIKDLDPLQERLASFPGPLKGKSKKKDLSAWLASGTEILEQNASYLRTVSNLSHEDKRLEERILLWKILRVFIEHDGTLEGTPVVDKAVRAVLSPGLDDEGAPAPLYATGADLSGISHSSNSTTRADPVDPAAVDQLRKHLLRGEREKAVWDAVDKRLWAHAMLISNTVSKELYKQVAQEFVQKEVKCIGDNVEPLAALYEIFAGNFEESIDELVPPSARAGFQMVSTSNGSGPSKDALDGLDRWRETLGLVLSNRSTDDSKALNALGKLLSGYGRAEAAHICFLFARSLSIFGGMDDPQASIVLVGSDQSRQPYDFDRELEPILLSEVFEYGLALSSTSTMAISSPHLAGYKLQHAKVLAEHGFRDKALQYCEAIATSITSQTRRSPYHHGLLASELEDLGKRLKQSPKDGTSSWISKPSIDKAKGSVWATFNKFVAGDEPEAAAAASAPGAAADIGPFSRIAGGTPRISRSPSNADIYGSYPGGVGIITKASSRYAPGASSYSNQDAQAGISYGSQPRTSLDERSSSEFKRYEPQRQMSDYRTNGQPAQANSYTPQTGSSFTPQSTYTPFGNSSPYEPSSGHAPQTPVTEQPPTNLYASPQAVNSFDGYRPPYTPSEPSYQQPPSSFDSPSLNSYDPPASASYEPPAVSSHEAPSYEPHAGGYEPQSGGYEPPSSGYVPYESNDEPDSPIENRPKKKSFMDDDEDDIPSMKAAPSSGEKSKAEKDKEADEAFRKAAEADAQKSKEAAPAKKGWGLGSWFGGAKKESQDMGANPNKPIRAKLGEASSFYYDPHLKRWVNKKAGADEDTQAKSATPPPPRAAGPPRTASAPINMGPPGAAATGGPPTSTPRLVPSAMNMLPGMAPQMLAQRAVSDSNHLFSSPQSDDGSVNLNAPPLMNRSQSNGSLRSSGPPSRPGTGMSNASSIDDLLGPPVPRSRKDAGGAVAKKGAKKKGRGYVDVMGGDK